MRIAIIGAGFSGLAAGYKLAKKHQVTIFEKTGSLGGLAATYRQKNWQYSVEQHYHHWFQNDKYALDLIKELGLSDKLIFPKTITSIYYEDKIYPFNTPRDVLTFSPLSLLDRFRTGLVTLMLKLLPLKVGQSLESVTAYSWLQKYYGEKAFQILWQPLLSGKFGPPRGGFADKVSMAWFWARIKKRTPLLGYLSGGYDPLIQGLAVAIQKSGGLILLNTSFQEKDKKGFDKIIVTAPSVIFTKLFPELPAGYKKRVNSIPHLFALNLLVICNEKILSDTYWLNINDRSFPFLAIVQQTNLVPHSHFHGQNLAYIANYLPPDHPYLKMSARQLFDLYLPYIQKINPVFNWKLKIDNCKLFVGPYAQPVMQTNYSKVIPTLQTPLPHVYLANMDMVYPWDRGTNYAIELGYKAARMVEEEK